MVLGTGMGCMYGMHFTDQPIANFRDAANVDQRLKRQMFLGRAKRAFGFPYFQKALLYLYTVQHKGLFGAGESKRSMLNRIVNKNFLEYCPLYAWHQKENAWKKTTGQAVATRRLALTHEQNKKRLETINRRYVTPPVMHGLVIMQLKIRSWYN